MRRLDIHNPFNAPVYHEETVDSTMEVSRFLAHNGAPHGTVITADFQEAGRGRIRDRRWMMERGNDLAFTVLLRFGGQTPPELRGAIPILEGQTPLELRSAAADTIPSGLTLRAGLAVALAIEDFAPALAGKALIKWPNDILLPSVRDDKAPVLKAAGILTEAENGNVHIGIGVNLTGDRHFLNGKATSVRLAAGGDGDRHSERHDDKGFFLCVFGDRHSLLGKILSRLYDEIEISKSATPGWRERIEARLYKKGEQIRFAKGAADSGLVVTGILAGIGPAGELLVLPSSGTGTLAFTAGELLFFS